MPFCENITFFVSGHYLLQQDTDASIDATCGIQAIKKNKYFHQYSLICCENVCVVWCQFMTCSTCFFYTDVIMDVPVLTPFFQKASFHKQSFNLLLLFSFGSCQHWFVNVSKFLWHKAKQQFTIIRNLITKEGALDEIPGSHQRNLRIACTVLRRIYFPTLTVHSPWLERLWVLSSAVLMSEVANGRVSLDTGP